MKELSSLILVLVLCSCTNTNQLKKDINYFSEVNDYFKTLNDERKSNYLQLIALYPLKEGSNTFGKDSLNDLTLDFDLIPNYIGNFYKKGKYLEFQSTKDLQVQTIKDSIILNMPIKIDVHGNSIKLFHQNFIMISKEADILKKLQKLIAKEKKYRRDERDREARLMGIE